MKKVLFVVFLLSPLFIFSQQIPPRPVPARLVNDFAHVLTSDQLATLESKLVSYDDSTSNQVVIVTVETLGDQPIEDYALGILRNWGVGNKKSNNGVVIVAAIKDQKIRIETGYGLEGAIPDITANQIIQNNIIPNFRAGNFYRGFDEATDQIFKAAAGEYKAPEGYRKTTSGRRSGGGLPFFLIILILVFLFSRRGGGGRGGGMMSRRGGFGSGALTGAILGNLLGGGGRGGWSGGGGGGWSGGGGGFGGFGGGSGGGGGASGSW